MNKLDRLRETAGATARASAGPINPPVCHGEPPPVRGEPPLRYQGVTRYKEANLVRVDRIAPDPDQPRKEFDAEGLGRLAASIRARGVLAPILVRWDEAAGVHRLIAGERRWRAAAQAGLVEIPAIVADRDYSAEELIEIQLVENALREDLRPIEQAHAYKRLMDRRGWSLRDVAAEVHVSHNTVARALALLDLPEAVQASVDAGRLGPSVAAELVKLDDPAVQAEVARAVIQEGLSRDDVTAVVRALKDRRPAPPPRPEPWAVDVGDGVTVTIRWKRAGGPTAAQALAKAARLAREGERKTG